MSTSAPSALGYQITASNWRPAPASARDHLGYCTLRVMPVGLDLDDARISIQAHGLRVTFSRRHAMLGGSPLLDRAGQPVKARTVGFADSEAWRRFSDAAVTAIEYTYPGELARAAHAPGRQINAACRIPTTTANTPPLPAHAATQAAA